MYQIGRLNHRHEQIVNWLVCNPDKRLAECAAHFNFTQAWLSQVIHSDVFQARYQERCREVGVVAMHSIANKLNTVAALTLEAAENRLRAGNVTEKFIGETMSTTLKMLGYGATEEVAKGGDTHNHLHVHADDLQSARQLAENAFAGQSQKKVSNNDRGQQQLPAPSAA